MFGRIFVLSLLAAFSCNLIVVSSSLRGQQSVDYLRKLQLQAVETGECQWSHWGDAKGKYSNWTNHSNRLIPTYTFGVTLDSVRGENSVYRHSEKLERLYGYTPQETLNLEAEYFDQTDIHHINLAAFKNATKKHIILMVFDGMDWDTAHAAALYRDHNPEKLLGRGWDTGLSFTDYRLAAVSDRGYCVTSPHSSGADVDVNSQSVKASSRRRGGYCALLGGEAAWSKPPNPSYLKGNWRGLEHAYTDSAASATSLNSGDKVFNGSINVAPDGQLLIPLAREMQAQGFATGVVTSVPISHATPAAVYANNVTRNDYQDLTRDLLGLRSINHRKNRLPGVDVLLGCGWGEVKDDDRENQGSNYIPGNKYIADSDLSTIDVAGGGKYVVAQRTADQSGATVLAQAAVKAVSYNKRLFGFFGVAGGHLPYQTADGNFDPTRGVSKAEQYSDADVLENPTLAQMTVAALQVLERNERGFYLMVEAGDVDWANHNNNIDNAIGAVFSGDDAFKVVCQWVQQNSNWEETQVIVTSDHGHMFFLDDPEVFAAGLPPAPPQQCPPDTEVPSD